MMGRRIVEGRGVELKKYREKDCSLMGRKTINIYLATREYFGFHGKGFKWDGEKD